MLNQYSQSCFAVHIKHCQWHPDSAAPFSLQLHGCNVLFQKLLKNFCFMPFMHVQSTSENKPAYFCLSAMRYTSKRGFSKFPHKKLQLLSGAIRKAVFRLLGFLVSFCLFFSQMAKSRTLRSYPHFWNALLIFLIFRNEYGRAVLVGMYKVTQLAASKV